MLKLPVLIVQIFKPLEATPGCTANQWQGKSALRMLMVYQVALCPCISASQVALSLKYFRLCYAKKTATTLIFPEQF